MAGGPRVDGTEPILDDEILYRRVPLSMGWYDPEGKPPLSYFAFRPRKDETTPVSVYRGKYKRPEQVAVSPRPTARYYVVKLRAGDLRARGIQVLPDPQPEDPGHSVIAELVYATRDTTRSIEIQKQLAEELSLCVHGPFPS